MNNAQRLRCVELAVSLPIRPDQVMQYAEMFTRFTTGELGLGELMEQGHDGLCGGLANNRDH